MVITKYDNVAAEVMLAEGKHIRQYHRTDDTNSPPAIISEDNLTAAELKNGAWEYDETGTSFVRQKIESQLIEKLKTQLDTMEQCHMAVGKGRFLILEDNLFGIVLKTADETIYAQLVRKQVKSQINLSSFQSVNVCRYTDSLKRCAAETMAELDEKMYALMPNGSGNAAGLDG